MSEPHSEHLAAFRDWALAENASPYADWHIRRAEARELFEQLETQRRALQRIYEWRHIQHTGQVRDIAYEALQRTASNPASRPS